MDIALRADEHDAAAPSVGRVDFGDGDRRSPPDPGYESVITGRAST